MSEAETFLKQAVLFLILALAIFLPFRINFSRNYFVVYVVSVLLFCWFYASLFFGFDIRSVGQAGNMLAGSISQKMGAVEFDKSMEAFEQKKNELIEKFKQSGLSKEEILKKLEPVNEQMIYGYADKVYQKIKKEIRFVSSKNEGETPQSTEVNKEFLANFRIDPKALMNVEGIEEAIRELKAKDIYSDEIKAEMDRLKSFIMNAQILDHDGG